MFHARRLCLFFMVVFLAIQTNEGLCRMKFSISDEMFARCEEAIAVYVKKNRNWDKGTYRLTFGGIYEFHNAAAFGVTSYAVEEELKRKIKAGERIINDHSPDDFDVLVDIVDYVVLSENRIDTFFPNAKPGYEYAVPPTKENNTVSETAP